MALCHLVKAEVPLDAQPCPGCLVELPAIEVSETAMPTKVAYRNLLNGMDAFNEHRAYAPRAELRFLVQSQNPGKVLSGLTASIAGAELDMPLQIDKDGIFELPRLEGTTAKDSSVIVNRREGSIRLRPYVRSQNTTPERRRMGDLRLECEIIWSLERDNLMRMLRLVVLMMLTVWGATIVACGRDKKSNDPTAPLGDMTLKEFILQKPSKPTAVQVDCKLDTYYNYAFSSCAETHYSFRVTSHSPVASAHAYAPKISVYGRRLYELLKDGSNHQMTLRLQRVGPGSDVLPAKHDSCFALVGTVDGKK